MFGWRREMKTITQILGPVCLCPRVLTDKILTSAKQGLRAIQLSGGLISCRPNERKYKPNSTGHKKETLKKNPNRCLPIEEYERMHWILPTGVCSGGTRAPMGTTALAPNVWHERAEAVCFLTSIVVMMISLFLHSWFLTSDNWLVPDRFGYRRPELHHIFQRKLSYPA